MERSGKEKRGRGEGGKEGGAEGFLTSDQGCYSALPLALSLSLSFFNLPRLFIL